MQYVQPITITIERDVRGHKVLRTRVLDGPCKHANIDAQRETETHVDVLCIDCGHGWKSVLERP